jgi:hypothetical protein
MSFAAILLMLLVLNNVAVGSSMVSYDGGASIFIKNIPPTGSQEYFYIKIYIETY